jgi:hypothetical protein
MGRMAENSCCPDFIYLFIFFFFFAAVRAHVYGNHQEREFSSDFSLDCRFRADTAIGSGVTVQMFQLPRKHVPNPPIDLYHPRSVDPRIFRVHLDCVVIIVIFSFINAKH